MLFKFRTDDPVSRAAFGDHTTHRAASLWGAWCFTAGSSARARFLPRGAHLAEQPSPASELHVRSGSGPAASAVCRRHCVRGPRRAWRATAPHSHQSEAGRHSHKSYRLGGRLQPELQRRQTHDSPRLLGSLPSHRRLPRQNREASHFPGETGWRWTNPRPFHRVHQPQMLQPHGLAANGHRGRDSTRRGGGQGQGIALLCGPAEPTATGRYLPLMHKLDATRINREPASRCPGALAAL